MLNSLPKIRLPYTAKRLGAILTGMQAPRSLSSSKAGLGGGKPFCVSTLFPVKQSSPVLHLTPSLQLSRSSCAAALPSKLQQDICGHTAGKQQGCLVLAPPQLRHLKVGAVGLCR